MRTTLLFMAGLALISAPPANARSAFFWDVAEGSRLSVDYVELKNSDLESPTQGDIGGQRSTIAAQYDFAAKGQWVLAAGHEYNALDMAIEPGKNLQTNGDLHTLYLATRWLGMIGPGRLQLAFAPALSVSSNALKDSDTWNSGSRQWWGAATYIIPGNKVDWVFGLGHDYRFGDPRTYPVAGLQWRDNLHRVLLTYPDISLVRVLDGAWTLGFTTAPDGNRWQAWDRNLEESDDFRRQAWQSELYLRFGLRNGLRFGLAVGYHWNQQWKYRNQNGGVNRLAADDSSYVGLHLGWKPSGGR